MRNYVKILVILVAVKFIGSSALNEKSVSPFNSSALLNIYYFVDYVIIIVSLYSMILFKGAINVFSILLTIGALFLIYSLSSIYIGISIDTIASSFLRTFSPLIMFIALINKNDGSNNLKFNIPLYLPIVVITLSLIGYLIFSASENRGENFWPTYTDGLHTQSYCLIAVYITIYIYTSTKKGIFHYVLLAAFFYALAYGYNVRTTISMLILFLGLVYYYEKLRHKVPPGFFHFFFSLGIGLLIIFCLFIFQIEDYDMFSSGRLSMYAFKFHDISQRTFIEILFGKGVGSDLVVTDIWWWDAKGSHNDYLTIFVENGLIYLVSFIIFIRYLYFKLVSDTWIRSILTVYLMSSLISNGFISRPLPSYLLFMSAYFVGQRRQIVSIQSKNKNIYFPNNVQLQ